MELDPAWLPFLYFIVGYLIYWFAPESARWRRWAGYGRLEEGPASRNSLYAQKFLGFLLLGPVALAAVALWGPAPSEAWYGLALPSGPHALWWFLGVSLATAGLMAVRAKKTLAIEDYPQVRLEVWRPTDLFWNTLLWALYLVSYELAFRGLMFFPLLEVVGFWPAAIVGSVLYSAVHIAKGSREAFLSLPYGTLLCFIAMDTGSFVIPFVSHLIMALMNEYRSLAANPAMKVVRS